MCIRDSSVEGVTRTPRGSGREEGHRLSAVTHSGPRLASGTPVPTVPVSYTHLRAHETRRHL
eukprot:5677092-Prorocentrum_lima.AAC.1